MKIVLASSSERRRELLENLLSKYSMPFDVIASIKDENIIKEEIHTPKELVEALSNMKAEEVFEKVKVVYPDITVIGADTVVSFNNEILGKPYTEDKALEMLHTLQGDTNDVYTGMTVIVKKGDKIEKKTITSIATVQMRYMSDEDINWYVRTKEPLDKAGAYAVQGIGSKFIEKYEGDFNAIIGLDTKGLEEVLKEYGVVRI